MNANIQDKPGQADRAGNAYLSDLEALRSRGGLRASIVREGMIRVGDIIEVISGPMEDLR